LFVGSEFESIRKFCHMNQFQSAIMVFISHNFMESELVRELETKFKGIDLNGDGQISWEEFHRCYLESMPPLPDTDLRSLFQKLDKNHSGFIDYSCTHRSTQNSSVPPSTTTTSSARTWWAGPST
jgi:Ca2+-binding EF-hand superfamily protein